MGFWSRSLNVCLQAFMELLQNLIQYVYQMADKPPVNKILGVILK